MPEGARTPTNVTSVPELDNSDELESKDIALCREMVDMLHWKTELGCADTSHEGSILSQHQASPGANHVRQLLLIFSHLENGHKLSLHSDSNLPAMDESKFPRDTPDFLKRRHGAKEEPPRSFQGLEASWL